MLSKLVTYQRVYINLYILHSNIYGGFLKWEYSQILPNRTIFSIEIHGFGVPLFWETSTYIYIHLSIIYLSIYLIYHIYWLSLRKGHRANFRLVPSRKILSDMLSQNAHRYTIYISVQVWYRTHSTNMRDMEPPHASQPSSKDKEEALCWWIWWMACLKHSHLALSPLDEARGFPLGISRD